MKILKSNLQTWDKYFYALYSSLTTNNFYKICLAINNCRIYLYNLNHVVKEAPERECVKIVIINNSENYIHKDLAPRLVTVCIICSKPQPRTPSPPDAMLWRCTFIIIKLSFKVMQ